MTSVLLFFISAVISWHSYASALPDTIARVKPAIVGVGTYNKLGAPKAKLLATGFAVRQNMIATNAHVVSKAALTKGGQFAIFIGKGSKAQVRMASIISTDDIHDLALLKVEGPLLPTLKLSSQNVREGEFYSFTGFPIGSVLGLYPVTHRGMISSITPIATPANSAKQLSIKRLKRLKKPYDVYQLDATAYPGNSGSPLYDQQTGQVIAIINKVFVKESKESVLQDPSAITFAIPVIYLKQLLANQGK